MKDDLKNALSKLLFWWAGLSYDERRSQVKSWFIWLSCFFMVACSAFYLPAPNKLNYDKVVVSIYQYLFFFGPFVIAFNAFLNGGLDWKNYRVTGFIVQVGYLLGALYMIAFSGDVIYKAVLANPAESIAFVVVFAFLNMLIRTMPIARSWYSASGARGYAVSGALMRPSKQTERDHVVTAAHEAGHMVMFAALDRLPDNFKAEIITDQHDDYGRLGYVSGHVWDYQLASRELIEWRMMMTLAGNLAEHVLLGEMTVGAISDMRTWQKLAHDYLSNGFGGTYFIEPKNEFEAALNRQMLDLLAAKQKADVTECLVANKDVVIHLSSLLKEHRVLNADKVRDVLKNVDLGTKVPKVCTGTAAFLQ